MSESKIRCVCECCEAERRIAEDNQIRAMRQLLATKTNSYERAEILHHIRLRKKEIRDGKVV